MYKKRLIVFLLIFTITISLGIFSKNALGYYNNSKPIVVENYKQFYNALNNAIVNKQSKIVVSIKKYNAKTFNPTEVLKVILNNNKTLKFILSDMSYSVYTTAGTAELNCSFSYTNCNFVVNNQQELLKGLSDRIKNKAPNVIIRLNGSVKSYALDNLEESMQKALGDTSFSFLNEGIITIATLNETCFKLTLKYNTQNNTPVKVPRAGIGEGSKQNISADINNLGDVSPLIKQAMAEGISEISFHLKNAAVISFDSFSKQVTKIIEENSEYRYFNKWNTSYSSNGQEATFKVAFNLNFTQEKINSMETEVKDIIKRIISQEILPGMSDYDKELKLHDYLVKSTRYDEANYDAGTVPEEDYTAYGVLIKGSGVCEGYTYAMKRLLDGVGIESYVVTGEVFGAATGPHAWNIVKLGNKYYELDVTFDDPVTNGGKIDVLSHDYFNLTDDMLSKDHKWDKSKYPACNSTDKMFK